MASSELKLKAAYKIMESRTIRFAFFRYDIKTDVFNSSDFINLSILFLEIFPDFKDVDTFESFILFALTLVLKLFILFKFYC